MSYLLDTCAISDFFKKHPRVLEHFQNHAPCLFYISSVTYFEIEYGLSLNPSRAQKLRPVWENLLELIHVTSFSTEDARSAAAIRADLKKKGTPIGFYDVLIAGAALSRKLTLVTSGTKEFRRIEDLSIEDWREESLINK